MGGSGGRRTQLFVGLSGLALIIAGSAAVWLSVRSSEQGELQVLSAVAGKVAPGVYLLGELSPSASYVVETTDGLVLVDSGMEANAAAVTAQLGQLHLDKSKLHAILLTHVHGDHSLGAAHLRALTGAKVYAGKGDARPLREGRPREAFFSTFDSVGVDPHPTTVDFELSGDEVFAVGATRFTALAAPGHTPGSVCYLADHRGKRILFTGDVIQCLRPAARGALGTYAAYLPPRYRGSAEDYLASLRRLRELPAPDLVLPGHPRMDLPAQDPRMTAGQWHGLLEAGIAELTTLLDRYRKDGANFLDGNAKELLPGLRYLGDYEQAPVYCLDTPKGLCLFDAPGGSGLVDWLPSRLKDAGWEGRRLEAILLTSADTKATLGLPALVESAHCSVVAPEAGMELVRKLCPEGTTVIPGAEFAKLQWFEVSVIRLRGRGVAAQAFRFGWAGKTVLASGRIPVKMSQATILQLMRDFVGTGDRSVEYLASLEALRPLNPQLWLPAAPVHGQNANLYDRDWEDVLDENRRMVR